MWLTLFSLRRGHTAAQVSWGVHFAPPPCGQQGKDGLVGLRMASQRMAKSLALGESSGRGYSSTGCGASPWTHGCQSPRGPGAWVRARSSQQVSGCRSRREDGGASLQVLSSWTPSLRPSSPGLAPEWRPPGIHREGRPGDAGQVVEEERRQSGLRPERSLPWELDPCPICYYPSSCHTGG